ncbi:hypothetical protein NDU88_007439 [Pleurodeles waltl]|uniref:Uncharacterized protein n=1 Tax=Pleurodeles waltl TaxID=8319 RepID=A0AAV7PLC7_PLEWA|nr:hypothetical protein NDU88_007439 [Pleurodeles waltl]
MANASPTWCLSSSGDLRYVALDEPSISLMQGALKLCSDLTSRSLHCTSLPWPVRQVAQGQDAADESALRVVPAQDHHGGANGGRKEERGKRKLHSGPQRLSPRAAGAQTGSSLGTSAGPRA